MQSYSLQLSLCFFALAGRAAHGRLCIVTSCDAINPISPDVGTQLGESESRIKCDNALAEVGPQLALTTGAHVEVVDIDSERVSELFALCRLRIQEVGSEVHGATKDSEDVAIIEQKGVLSKTFCMFIKMFYAGRLVI